MEIFDPTVSAEQEAFSYAPRPKDLQGLHVGLVENTKYNSETILRKIAERLDERYKIKVSYLDHKQSSSHSVTEEAIAKLKEQSDFVIAGVGDWGSCSSGSVLDGIKLERAGIPAVSIVTHVFVETGAEMAASHGVPDYAFLVTPHPIANLTEAELDVTADKLTAEVVDFLARTGNGG